MAIQIELTPQIEQRLRQEAAQHGQDISVFTQSLIEERLGSSPLKNGGVNDEGETLDKTLAGHIGLIDVRPSVLMEKTGDAFTDGLIEKYRKQGLTV